MLASPAPVASRPRRVLHAALAFALGALLFERVSGQSFFDPDGFHEMATFREWLRAGALPRVDTFAFTHTIVPTVHHEWGAGAVLYELAVHTGAPGVMVARWLLAIAIVCVAARAALRHAAPIVVAFAAAPAILMASFAFTSIRAGVYTMLLLALALAMLDADRERPRPWRFVGLYLIVFAVWINLHAGWVVGVAAVGLHAIEQALGRRPVRHLFLALLTTPFLMFATPYGAAYYVGWWRSISHPRSGILEWAPLAQSSYALGLGAFALAVLLLAYAIVRRGPHRLPGILFVVAAAWAAWRHERHVALFALAWFCAVPRYLTETPLADLLARAAGRRPIAGLATAAALASGVALVAVGLARNPFTLHVPAQPSDVGAAPVVYPAGAVDYLRAAGFTGKLLTSFTNGGFVIWKLYPPVRVSFDGRYEVAYGSELLAEDAVIHGALPGWRALVERYAPDALLVERNEPLAATLPRAATFERAYRDDVYEVWAPRGSGLPRRDRSGQPIAVTFP
jgi:hypothetical protein